LAGQFGLEGHQVLEPYFEELEQIITGISLVGEASPRLQARVMAMGELMSTTLSHAYLRQQGYESSWVDARKWLRSRRDEPISTKASNPLPV
jgi:diaminopimelate decarboxylase/aspartate kinase